MEGEENSQSSSMISLHHLVSPVDYILPVVDDDQTFRSKLSGTVHTVPYNVIVVS